MRTNLLASICLFSLPLASAGAMAAQMQPMPPSSTPPMAPMPMPMPMPPGDPAMPAEPAAPAMPGMPGMPGEPAMPAESAQPAVPGQQTIIDNTLPLPPPGQSSYPLCSATLQDQCINPSEAPRSMRQTKRRSGKRG